jgi:DNA-binding CsgD family transcriptional regulator
MHVNSLPRVAARKTSAKSFTIETGERFGRLVVLDGRRRHARSKETCYGVFYERSAPCEDCPIADRSESGVFVMSSEAEPMLMIVSDRGSEADVAAVEIDANLSQAVCRAWIARLEHDHLLSTQERAVLELLVLGRTHEDIGLVMGISTRTVRFHQANLLEKLGAESRADLLRLLMGSDVRPQRKPRRRLA